MYELEILRREQFPITEQHIYFQNAGIAPLPVRVAGRMQAAVDHLVAQPLDWFMEEYQPLLEATMALAADHINAADPDEIVPISSTSAGLNALAQALDWSEGDNLCFCDIEFPSNAYPWLSLARDGVEVRQVPALGGGLRLEALADHVDERTRLVAVSAVQFLTGHRTDLEAIGRFCREREILFVVDAIQAIGHMPINVQTMQIDALATGGQKSLLCAPGIGFMYVRDELCPRLQPRMVCSNATENYLHWLDYDLAPRAGAARFMTGTPNVVGLVALQESLTFLQELGVVEIGRHTQALSAAAMELVEELGYKAITPRDCYGPIVTFRTGLTEADTDALVADLKTHNISVTKHLDKAGEPHVRLSFHCYNSLEELERFGEALGEFILSEGPDW